MRLETGEQAPQFELSDTDGKTWRLADQQGGKVILFFYPKDDTPGCTTEACDFRDARTDLDAAGYQVIGVSPQDASSHRRFTDRYGLDFPLLVDEDHSVADRYGAWGEKKNYGKTYEGIIRSTFVIDEGGRIEHALYNVRAKGHVEKLKGTLGV